jgi:hypothetical protein
MQLAHETFSPSPSASLRNVMYMAQGGDIYGKKAGPLKAEDLTMEVRLLFDY